jgi:hypothetical protein
MLPLSLLLAFVGCNAEHDAPGDAASAMTIRSYTVPPGQEATVESTLNRLFYVGEGVAPVGRVHEGPPGTVVIAAPASVQDSVKEVIEVFAKAGPASAPRNIRISWWLVAGRKAAEVDTHALPPDVASAMATVSGHEPPMVYTLRYTQELLGLDGEHARASGDTFSIDQMASATPQGEIVADLRVDMAGGLGASTRVHLVPGQVLVLGDTGPAGLEGIDGLFYVLRPEFVSGS